MGWFRKLKEKVTQATDTVKEAVRFDRLKQGLAKTRSSLISTLENLLQPGRRIEPELFEELEATLITADIGVSLTMEILGRVEAEAKRQKLEDASQLLSLLHQEILRTFTQVLQNHTFLTQRIATGERPYVILVVGVNGVGKTTTIGKLAYQLKQMGLEVLIGAADTFRAAANEQLEIWARRAGVDIIQQKQGADPAAVAFDTLQAAQRRQADVVLIDTAGRLHNKEGLMRELSKISRVLKKLKPSAPDDVLLVLDATIGQNALQQARTFQQFVPLTGVILTKLDGTAKGGIVVAVAHELQIPVEYVGVGEGLEDLQPFDPEAFVEALFAETAASSSSPTSSATAAH